MPGHIPRRILFYFGPLAFLYWVSPRSCSLYVGSMLLGIIYTGYYTMFLLSAFSLSTFSAGYSQGFR
jgi:hypothetical protein